MPTYIQSFEDAPWCVNNEPRQIQAGQVVAFDNDWEAAHFVKLERAGLIGDFGDEKQALAELERLVAANEAARQAAQHDQVPPQEDDVKDRETKAVTADGMEVSAPAAPPEPEAQKAKTGSKKGK